jgi:hypothetical protein
LIGFIVTWDVDSHDASLCARLSRFVFGYSIGKNGKVYRYPGFVEREGVRYLGQSVLFVTPDALKELDSFLHQNGIDHVVVSARLGSIMNNCAELSGTLTDARIMNNCAETSGTA